MTDRLVTAARDLVLALVPDLARFLKWEYRVTAASPGQPVLISGEPVTTGGQYPCPYGSLANITLWPGPDGSYALPANGSLILVEFHEGNPAKPSVCGLDPHSTPILTTIAGGGSAVARVGDDVTVTQTEITAATMVAGPYSVTISLPLKGKITSGSTKAECG